MKDSTRRKAIKALTVGAPAVWVKPEVDSLLLPAHAVMTPTCSLTIPVQQVICGGDPTNGFEITPYLVQENSAAECGFELIQESSYTIPTSGNPFNEIAPNRILVVRQQGSFLRLDVHGHDETGALSPGSDGFQSGCTTGANGTTTVDTTVVDTGGTTRAVSTIIESIANTSITSIPTSVSA